HLSLARWILGAARCGRRSPDRGLFSSATDKARSTGALPAQWTVLVQRRLSRRRLDGHGFGSNPVRARIPGRDRHCWRRAFLDRNVPLRLVLELWDIILDLSRTDNALAPAVVTRSMSLR